jgi:hypothetical protein
MTTKSALSTLVMARILGRRPTPSRITWTELKCSSPLWQCLCSLLEADFLFFQEASDFGNELHEVVRISGNARLRGSSFASRVRGAIVGSELFVELPLGVCG